MQRIAIGTKVQPLGINRLNVADGCQCRAILVDQDPQMKYIAFDEELKRKVEVDQDLLIKYNLKASATFYYLVAKLNTDMKGNVVSDDFTIEYLQLSQNLQNDFCDAVQENPQFNSLKLTKVSKKGDGGKDFSYIKTVPSNYQVSQNITDAINKLRENPDAINSMWQLVDRATSISPAEYEILRNNPVAPRAIAPTTTKPQIAAPATPQSDDNFAEKNDFGGGDDFSEEF